MEKKNNILNQMEDYMMIGEAKRATKNVLEMIPDVAVINKTVYSEMRKQGFDDSQAFKFACDYTLKLMFNGDNDKDK